MKRILYLILLAIGFSIVFSPYAYRSETPDSAAAQPAPGMYFKIKVVDEDTGRGVPLVELKTVHEVRYYTDSNGGVAFYEPGLMNRKVFFHIKSHGYEYPQDAFGSRGVALEPKAGQEAVLKIKRLNIAERLYRITGGGIYRDSVLTGEEVPLKQPLLNGQVLGQDSVLQELYQGRLFWIWGDTSRPSYPLGNFSSSAATSELPGKGGLDPDRGVDLDYFVDETGFSKRMVPLEEEGMVWLSGLMAVHDRSGRERLLATFSRMKSLGERLEHGFVAFNDATQIFERLKIFEPGDPSAPGGHPIHLRVQGEQWLYFSEPFHLGVNLRVRATWEEATDLDAYEVLIPPRPATGEQATAPAEWKNIAQLRASDPQRWSALRDKRLSSGQSSPAYDINSGEPITPHGGSIYWNEYRQKWVAIFLQNWGNSSLIGEVWYAEADTPAGPWAYARKIVTHDDYSFYNVKHHPPFDQDGGRRLYFEGTYTKAFSGTQVATPRYDYNQIMYRLALDDPRLFLPVGVYQTKEADGCVNYLLGKEIEREDRWERVETIAFFACAPDRVREGCIPIWRTSKPGGGKSSVRLVRESPADSSEPPLFFAVAPENVSEGTPPSHVVPLYEYFSPATGEYRYSVDDDLDQPGWTRSSEALCQVWRNPRPVAVLDPAARPLPAGSTR